MRVPKTRAQGYTNAGTYSDALKADGRTPEHQIANLLEAYEQQLRHASLKLIAGILGEKPEELEECDDQLRRQEAEAHAAAQVRAKLKARRIAFAVSVLAVAACGASGFALHQRWKAVAAATAAQKARDQANAWGDMAFTALVARLPNILEGEEYGTLLVLVSQLENLKGNAPSQSVARINSIVEAVRHQYLAAHSEVAKDFPAAVAHHEQRLGYLRSLAQFQFGDSDVVTKQVASGFFSLAGAASQIGDFGKSMVALKHALDSEMHVQSVEIADQKRRFAFSRMCQNIAMRMYAANQMKYAADAFGVESEVLKSAYLTGAGSFDGPLRLARATENRGRCLFALGNKSEALLLQRESLTVLEDALKRTEGGNAKPKDKALVLNRIAWSLATTPHEELRDGKRALNHATEACDVTQFLKPDYLDTLAAAHAANGDFAEAAKIQGQVIAKYRDLEPTNAASLLAEEHQKSYLRGSIWQQVAPEGRID